MLRPLILLVVLIFLNAIFASAEIAVLSMSETRLKMLAENGDRRAKKLMFLMEQPARFLATIQVAITLAGLLQSAFAAENFAGPLAAGLVSIGVPMAESVLRSVCIVVITVILAYFTLVFGELVPKRIAMKKTETMALGMAGLLYFVAKAFAPIVGFLTASTNLILRIFKINPADEEQAVSEEEIRMMLAEGEEKGTIPSEENEMIQNVFEFNDISVVEICTHRKEVDFLWSRQEDAEWEQMLGRTEHAYYPVWDDSQRDVVGVLDARIYLRMKHRTRACVMQQAVHVPYFVPETMKANALFEQMKQRKEYFAVVVDEFGTIAGIVTLHDIMESLVGELEDTVVI